MSDLIAREYMCFEDIKHVRSDGSEYWCARDLALVLDYSKWENLKYTLNFKIPAVDDETLERLILREHVKYIMKTVSYVTYCEVVIGGFDTKEDLLAELVAIKEEYPGLVSDDVVKNARKLTENG